MKRLTYILFAVFLFQVSGVRDLCFSQPRASHHCCPASKGNSIPSPSSLPDCCLSMALTVQASVAEVSSGTDHTVTLQPIETQLTINSIPPRPERQTEPLTSSGLTLPPLSPLLQTCQLLI